MQYWLGDLYLFIYDFLEEKEIEFEEKDVYIFILCLIKNKNVKQVPICYDFLEYSLEEIKVENYPQFNDLQNQLNDYYNYLDDVKSIKELNHDLKSFSQLPNYDFKDLSSITRAVEVLERWFMYFWYDLETKDLNSLLEEAFLDFLDKKSHK